MLFVVGSDIRGSVISWKCAFLDAQYGLHTSPRNSNNLFYIWSLFSLRFHLYLGHVHRVIIQVRAGDKWLNALTSFRLLCVGAFTVVFMFLYTSLFGILVSYVYLRTGTIVSAILTHSLCNLFSIPTFSFLSRQSPLYKKRKSMAVGTS